MANKWKPQWGFLRTGGFYEGKKEQLVTEEGGGSISRFYSLKAKTFV